MSDCMRDVVVVTACPRCGGVLRELEDKSSLCCRCELHRRQNDKVRIRTDTNFWVLKRNVARVPPGSEVEVNMCNETSGIYGTFKGSIDWILKSKTGFVIATSRDIEDIAILIFENEWYITGPESLLAILDILADK